MNQLMPNLLFYSVKKILPISFQARLMKNDFFRLYILKPFYLIFGQPRRHAETSNAKRRRERELFFSRYCSGAGLDVGYGGDLLCDNCQGWDVEHGDAQYLSGTEDGKFDFVYSSHTLEHMDDPGIAIQNWWRVVKPGGYLILYIPHRDLYEKKTTLPSRWNDDHKHFFLLEKDEEPCTIGLIPLLYRTISDFEIVYSQICDEGHSIRTPEIHSNGEYSIEMVIKKSVK